MMVPNGFTDWAKPVGTGAFTVDSFDPGVRIALKKAGPYWKADRGHLDARRDHASSTTPATRMNALISGQVDAINRADPRTVSRIEKSPTLEIVRAAGGWYPVMAMMNDRDALHEPRPAPGAEICGRSRADDQDAVLGLWRARQRQSDPAQRSLLQRRARAVELRSRQGPLPLQEGRPRQSQDRAADLGCRLQRRGRHGDAASGHGLQMRYPDRGQDRSRPTATSPTSG